MFRAETRDWTRDLMIFSHTLSQLSYFGRQWKWMAVKQKPCWNSAQENINHILNKSPSSAGFEPATSGLEVRRAIHCATKTGVLSMYDNSNRDLPASVGGVKVSIVAFQAIDPGSIPGWRTFYIQKC